MRIFGGLAVLGLMAASLSPLLAQSASDFRLPEPGASPSSRPQGPIDADNPILVLPRPSASASTTATPTPTPIATPSLPVREAPAPVSGTSRNTATPAPRPTATASAGTAPAGAVLAPTQAPAPAPVRSTLPGASASPAPADSASTVPYPLTVDLAPGVIEEEAGSAWWWPYVAGAAALLAALFGFMLLRRRRPADPAMAFETPLIESPPESEPLPAPSQQRLADSLPEPIFNTAPTAPNVPELSLALEARRLNASLMATTLSYRLVLTNNGPEPLSALAIEGDMIAAHATLPQEQQVVQPAQRLELRHALSTLAPGESAEFSGDIRLPLAAITPIRAGEAALFIPLARFRIEAGEPNGRPLVVAQTFVVGEEPQASGGGLRPFRLDLGPRTYSRLSQRLVN